MQQLSLFDERPTDYGKVFWIERLAEVLAEGDCDGSEKSINKVFNKTEFAGLYRAMMKGKERWVLERMRELQTEQTNTSI